MDEKEALRHNIDCFKRIGFFEAKPMKTPINRMRFEDLEPNDPVRQRADSSEAIVQNYCSVCGVPVVHESNFCPNCGNPSKKLQVAAVEREQESERPALAYDMTGPQFGRLNVAGITAEIYDDQSVVILTPHPVSLTIDRLGSEMMGVFEVRVTPVREKDDARKAAAATSLVTPLTPSKDLDRPTG